MTGSDIEDRLSRGIAFVAFDYGPGRDQGMEPARAWKVLPLTQAGASQVRSLLVDHGAVDHFEGLDPSATPPDVAEAIEELLHNRLGADDTVCLYIGGHGQVLGDDHFIVGRSTSPDRLTVRTALSAGDLGNILAQSRAHRALVLIDACYSGEGATRAVEIFSSVSVAAARP